MNDVGSGRQPARHSSEREAGHRPAKVRHHAADPSTVVQIAKDPDRVRHLQMMEEEAADRDVHGGELVSCRINLVCLDGKPCFRGSATASLQCMLADVGDMPSDPGLAPRQASSQLDDEVAAPRRQIQDRDHRFVGGQEPQDRTPERLVGE